jgi:hypothetical protein
MELSGRPVRLEIEALVLDGVGPHDRRVLAASAERELERLLGERGVPPMLARGGEHLRLHGPSLQLARVHSTASLGADVARSVYGALEP